MKDTERCYKCGTPAVYDIDGYMCPTCKTFLDINDIMYEPSIDDICNEFIIDAFYDPDTNEYVTITENYLTHATVVKTEIVSMEPFIVSLEEAEGRSGTKLNIEGTSRFKYRTAGDVTEKQQNIINAIAEATGIVFEGNNSRDAYYFIQKHALTANIAIVTKP